MFLLSDQATPSSIGQEEGLSLLMMGPEVAENA